MPKTTFFSADSVKRQWVLIDAKNKILGRLATRIALILQGKHRAQYTPNIATGDTVVVINARHVRTTGKKEKEKMYHRYSGYPGGRKEIPLEVLRQKNATKALYYAVKRMLPKNTLGHRILRHQLKLYADGTHPHEGQNPKTIEV